jgi:hypothetical protein
MARLDPLGGYHTRRKARTTRAFLLAFGIALVLVVTRAAARRSGPRVLSRPQTASPSPAPLAPPGRSSGRAASPARAALRKRLPVAVGAVGTILAVSLSSPEATLAMFSGSQAGGVNSWAAGNVALGSVTSVQSCALSGVQPGTTTASASLATALTSGTTYTSLLVDSVSKAISSGDSLIIGQGNATQTVTASAAVATTSGPASIPVSAFTATTSIAAAGGMVIDITTPNTPCSFTFSTSSAGLGSYVAADIAVVGGSTGHANLWDGTANGLQVVVRDGAAPTHVFLVPVSTTACGSLSSEFTPPAGAGACGQVLNDLLDTGAVPASTSFTVYVDWALDGSVPASYAGGTAQVMVAFHSVQSGNNTLVCTSTATVGQPCTPGGSFSWS